MKIGAIVKVFIKMKFYSLHVDKCGMRRSKKKKGQFYLPVLAVERAKSEYNIYACVCACDNVVVIDRPMLAQKVKRPRKSRLVSGDTDQRK